MTSDSTTQARWPLLDSANAVGVHAETGRLWRPRHAPIVAAPRRTRGRHLSRSAWLLTGLAFLCGGLVSAAAFSIGWRHQAQRDTAARAALAAATARTHRLEQRITALQASLTGARGAAASAAATEKALAHAGTKVGADAT